VPQSLNGVEVHEVEAATSTQEGLSEPGCPDQWVDDEAKPPSLGDAIWVVYPVKSDQEFGPAQVLRDCRTHEVDRPTDEFEPSV
jgi:hypothetical protein